MGRGIGSNDGGEDRKKRSKVVGKTAKQTAKKSLEKARELQALHARLSKERDCMAMSNCKTSKVNIF